jgi:hypothetical protein
MLSHFLTIHFGWRRVGKANLTRRRSSISCRGRRSGSGSPPSRRRCSIASSPSPRTTCGRATTPPSSPGFRVRKEYLKLGRAHLRPEVFELEVPGTKTPESESVIPIDPVCWPMLERGVPPPIAYGQIRKHWMRVCLAEGFAVRAEDPYRPGKLRYKGPTLHDIRHLTGQFMTNAGVPEWAVQSYLRHTDPATTRGYTMQKLRAEAAAAMARVMGLVAV